LTPEEEFQYGGRLLQTGSTLIHCRGFKFLGAICVRSTVSDTCKRQKLNFINSDKNW